MVEVLGTAEFEEGFLGLSSADARAVARGIGLLLRMACIFGVDDFMLMILLSPLYFGYHDSTPFGTLCQNFASQVLDLNRWLRRGAESGLPESARSWWAKLRTLAQPLPRGEETECKRKQW